MSKIRNFMMIALLVLCVVPLFAGCEDDSPVINIDTRIWVNKVTFDNVSKEIPLVKGTTYTLEYSFDPFSATNKTVQFSSSNSEVATVDKYGNVTAVGSGTCIITIKSLDNKKALTDTARVTVVNEKETLSVPTNVRYDGNALTWDEVKVRSSTSFVPSYELTISRNGGEEEVKSTTNTTYTDLRDGAYQVKIRTMGDTNNVLYDNSESVTYSFTKLGLPTGLSITAEGSEEGEEARSYTLSFNLAENTTSIADYQYEIAPTSKSSSSYGLSEEQKAIWEKAINNCTYEYYEGTQTPKMAKIAIPEDFDGESVDIKFATKDDTSNNVYGTGFDNAECVRLGRLSAPTNLKVYSNNSGSKIENILSWNNVSNAYKYKLKVVYYDSEDQEIKTIYTSFNAQGVTSYNLSNLNDVPNNYKSYKVYLYSLGTSDTAEVRLDSESSSCAKQQIDNVQDEFDVQTETTSEQYTISWNPVKNASGYKVYISNNSNQSITKYDENSKIDTTESQISLGFKQTWSNGNSIWNEGANYIKIVAVANGEDFTDSNVTVLKNQCFIKLKTPELKVSKGALTWDTVAGASKYVITFASSESGKQKTVEINAENGKPSYSYEPSQEDFLGNSTCNVTISAKYDDDKNYIQSQESKSISLVRYAQISANKTLQIVLGNLSWGSGLVDDNGTSISANNVEIRVLKTSEPDNVLKTISATTVSGSLALDAALSGLDGSDFSFQIRAVNNLESGSLNINGDWSESIQTYQMKAPENLRISEGVLTWDKMIDSNVGEENRSVYYILKINTVAKENTSYGINTTSAILPDLSKGITYSISIQTRIGTATTGGSLTKTTEQTTYLINSEFSKAIAVKLAPQPTDLMIKDYTLSWNNSGYEVGKYRVCLYKEGEEKPLATEDVEGKTSLDFSTAGSFSEHIITAGNYEFEVWALGDSNYLTSYASKRISICKLATPKITISSTGQISWTSSSFKLDGVTQFINQFSLTVTNSKGETLTTQINNSTSTDLSFLKDLEEENWCGADNKLTISIKALSGNYERVYNSDTSTYGDSEIFKLPKLDISTITINESTQSLNWQYDNFKGQSGCYFIVYIYQENSYGKDICLVNGVSMMSTSAGTGSYTISSDWKGTNFYVKIKQAGFTTTDRKIALPSEDSDYRYFMRFNEATVISLSESENGEPVLNWKATNENDSLRYRVTLQKFNDNKQVTEEEQLIYYVSYDVNADNGWYSLNLYTNEGYNKNVTGTKDLRSLISNYYGEYQMYVTTVPKDDSAKTTTISNKEYLVMSSRASTKQTMTIFTAPTISLNGSKIKINNANASSRGVVLKFQEVKEEDSTFVASDKVETISLSSSTTSYEITSKLLDPSKLYQVTTQAVGNGKNLVSSPEVVSSTLLKKLDTLKPNTTKLTYENGKVNNTSAFNGWYVQKGRINWNKVNGATGYSIYMTSSGSSAVTRLVLDKTDSSSTAFSESLSDMGFASNYGVFKLQFLVKGGIEEKTDKLIAGKTASIGYLSSDLADSVTVNKLFTPNGTYNNSDISWLVYNPTGNPVSDSATSYNRKNAYARINDEGEFDFGIRNEDTSGEWIDASGVTAYRLVISKDNTTYEKEYAITNGVSASDAKFIASDEFKSSGAGTYTISMYSIGNDWYGDDSSPIYLNSDSQDSFKLIYSGVITDLSVVNGKISWLRNSSSDGNTQTTSSSGYFDFRYTPHDEVEKSAVLETTEFAFEGEDYDSLKGKIIDNIYVRYKGSETQANAIQGYVNTAWNDVPLTKVMKLPDIGKSTPKYSTSGEQVDLYIDSDRGYLAWAEGEALKDLNGDFDFVISYSISNDKGKVISSTQTPYNVKLAEGNYNVPIYNGDAVSRYYVYNIVAYVQGTLTQGPTNSVRFNDYENASVLYLNGKDYTFEAGKLNTPNSEKFLLDTDNGSVRISWDLTDCGITVDTVDTSTEAQGIKTVSAEADLILLSYKLGNSDAIERKIIKAEDFMFSANPNEGGTAFWKLGTFRELTLSVLNSKGQAFGSEAIGLKALNNDSSTYSVNEVIFDKFASGTGTREDPFVIKNYDELSNMFWLPEKFFKLGDNIKLPDLSELQQLYPSASTNIKYPKEFYDSDTKADYTYTSKNFTGGFDGNGKTISNYQVVKSISSSIWNYLSGSTLEPLKDEQGNVKDDVYQNTAGIITNLTVEVNTLDVSILRNTYNGILVSQNQGLIYNCHITGDDTKANDQDERLAVVEGVFTASDTGRKYYIGGIAGAVSDKKNYVRTVDEGTTSEKKVYEQGFIGRIENCTNMLDLQIIGANNNDVSVGGIVGLVNNGRVVNCTNGKSTATTAKNSGLISGFNAGGIAGSSVGTSYEVEKGDTESTSKQFYSYIYGCINFATINTTSIESDVYGCAGGIVGQMSYAYTTYCINYGTITMDGYAGSLGGICGSADDGSYIANIICGGKIAYNLYYDTATQEKTNVIAGAICGNAKNVNLYNAVYNDNSIECTILDGSVVHSSDAYPSISFIGNAIQISNVNDVDSETVDSLKSVSINAQDITIDDALTRVLFENINGKCPQFVVVKEDASSYWTFEWTREYQETVQQEV